MKVFLIAIELYFLENVEAVKVSIIALCVIIYALHC